MNEFVAWPQCPAFPAEGEPVLVRVAGRELRGALGEILEKWGGASSWRETSRGPVCDGVDISLSYAGDAGWIGLLRGGWIGIDAVQLEAFAEMDAVARLYLAPAAVKEARNPNAFALAWTEMEARLKCMKRGLAEWSPDRDAGAQSCVTRSFVTADAVAVTVACKFAETKLEPGRGRSRERIARV